MSRCVHIRDDRGPLGLPLYGCHLLPRHGEEISVQTPEGQVCVEVIDVEHWPYESPPLVFVTVRRLVRSLDEP